MLLQYKYKKRSLCILFLTVILIITCFAGCGKKDNTLQINSVDNNSEKMQVSDSLDPENLEPGNGTGAKVDADNLERQSGKANGVDVSKWQGKIDWKKVRSSGIDFAIIRIGFRGENGTIYKDSYAEYNIQQADDAGLLIGVYFFSTAVSTAEAEEEARWTVEAIKGYAISYPVVYDCEGFTKSDSRMYGVTNSQRTQNAITFLKFVSDNGYDGMLYSSKSELENSAYWDTDTLQASYKIWVARYTDIPYPGTPNPDYTGKYDMWQYTNMGSVNGIKGNTDMIVSYFTRGKATPKNPSSVKGKASAPAEADSTYSEVNDSVTAKELTNLRESASTKSNVVATLKNGEFVPRNGIGNNGWSKLNYNGKTVYAITSYLTTDKNYMPPVSQKPDENDEFTASSGQVTAKEETNLRSTPSTDGELIATIKNGEFVTKTGESSKGWTRIDYNGKTVYAKSSLLTTEVKSAPVQSEASQVSSQNGQSQFTTVDEHVTAKEETNLRSEPSSKDDTTIVYTLKNGEYVRRTGISNNGWSRLEYNGQIVYAVSSFLIN